MELPHLGEHCSELSCKRLDFLPVKCDACQKTFCTDHYAYTSHHCPEAYRKDNQVPVCPLCNNPVSLGPNGELPDVVVGRHIDNDCQSEMAQSRRKIYSNRCAVKGCKQKELVPLTCERCRKNFCLRHRHERDHECRGFQESGRAISSQGFGAVSRAAAMSSGPKNRPPSVPQQTAMSSIGGDLERERQQRRLQQQQPTTAPRLTAVTAHTLQQPGITEDEALRRAMEMSLQDSQPNQTSHVGSDTERRQQEEMDEALARALQESERESSQRRPVNTGRQQSEEKKNCVVS